MWRVAEGVEVEGGSRRSMGDNWPRVDAKLEGSAGVMRRWRRK